MSTDKISASNSKFENLRWTPYYKPRSSRGRGSRATFSVDEEVSKRLFSKRTDSLDDRGSGTGPPASSVQGDAELAEATA